MNFFIRKNKLIFAIIFSFFCTTSYGFDIERVQKFTREFQNPENGGNYTSCNNLLSISKGTYSTAEIARILSMTSKDKNIIRTTAIVSTVTSLFVLVSKLYAASKQKWIYNLEPTFYIYPILSILRNAYDTYNSAYILKNANTIAQNNIRNKADVGLQDYQKIILCTLAALEGGSSVWAHSVLGGTVKDGLSRRRNIETFDNIIVFDRNYLLLKTLSLTLWAIRHIYEAKYIKTSNFVTNFTNDEDKHEEKDSKENDNNNSWEEVK